MSQIVITKPVEGQVGQKPSDEGSGTGIVDRLRERWLEILGLLLALAGVAYVKEVRDGLAANAETIAAFIGSYWSIATAGVLAIGLFIAFRRTRDRRLLKRQLTIAEQRSRELAERNQELDKALNAETKLKAKYERGRWESITRILYGHVAYEPFLRYEGGSIPTGLGVELLSTLLGDGSGSIVLDYEGRKRNWNNILDGLAENKYDIVATPLFATFDRSMQVRFTAPLFFSNIGLYVNKEVAVETFWSRIETSTLKQDMKERAGNLKFLCVSGEISQKLAEKYSDSRNIDMRDSDTMPSALFNDIADSHRPPCALFCESYYAHHQPRVIQGDVVNVLPWHQILYPVCFAVRLGDYQLANLLNIRLLQLTQKQGALDLLATKLANTPNNPMNKTQVQRHFIAEWPCPELVGGDAHA